MTLYGEKKSFLDQKSLVIALSPFWVMGLPGSGPGSEGRPVTYNPSVSVGRKKWIRPWGKGIFGVG